MPHSWKELCHNSCSQKITHKHRDAAARITRKNEGLERLWFRRTMNFKEKAKNRFAREEVKSGLLVSLLKDQDTVIRAAGG